MKRLISVGVVIAFSVASISPAKSNPALLAPAAGLCGTGIGCVLVGTVIIGGIVYYVYSHQGRKIYVRKDAPQQNRSASQGMSGSEAARLGNAHWVNGVLKDCQKMEAKYGWRLRRAEKAQGGGVWCIFEGEQVDFSEGKTWGR